MRDRALAVARWLCGVPHLVGQRGLLLLAFAVTVIGYGTGLIAGYQPTFTSALGIPDELFGVMFLADGVILLLGAFLQWRRFPYAFAASVSFFWAFILTGFWALPFGWVASMSWLGMGLVQVIATIWPEPVGARNRVNVKTYKQTLYIITSSELVDDEIKEVRDDAPDE